MKRLILTALLICPVVVSADHIDVIEGQMNEGCSPQEYLAIVNDFNEDWGKDNGYQTEIFFPVQSNNMTSFYWVGRSANAAAFGAAFDRWTSDLGDPDSLATGLMARFSECSTTLSRRGYMAY